MKKVDFLNQVMRELKHIKQNATQEEIGNLNLNSFDPRSKYDCIYGQMTGKCNSFRAKQLTPKTYCVDIPSIGDTFIKSKRHGLLVTKNKGGYYTPLEMYIPMKNSKKEQIIQYLKGEKATLTL